MTIKYRVAATEKTRTKTYMYLCQTAKMGHMCDLVFGLTANQYTGCKPGFNVLYSIFNLAQIKSFRSHTSVFCAYQ